MARRSPFDAEGKLTDLPVDISYFDVLDLPVSLRLDEEMLREKFYALSRRVHPDRYVSSGPLDAVRATRWTTALNRAYQTLRDPGKRARYLLDVHGVPELKNPPVPMELAETYFELQDAEGAALGDFLADLRKREAAGADERDAIAEAWDAGPKENAELRKELLARLQRHLIGERYLQSMIADIERKLNGDRRD